MKIGKYLPAAVLVLIVGPATVNLMRKPPPEPAPVEVRAPEPTRPAQPATADAWFDAIRPRCTPADVRLATDLNPPPLGAEGIGYKAVCYGLARQIASARSLLLSLPDSERAGGAAILYGVAEEVAKEPRPDLAAPLLELVLELLPGHEGALFGAGQARFAMGDADAAHEYLERFLEVHPGEDSLSAQARHMMAARAER